MSIVFKVAERIKECKTDQAGKTVVACIVIVVVLVVGIGKQSRLLALNEGIEINARGAVNEV